MKKLGLFLGGTVVAFATLLCLTQVASAQSITLTGSATVTAPTGDISTPVPINGVAPTVPVTFSGNFSITGMGTPNRSAVVSVTYALQHYSLTPSGPPGSPLTNEAFQSVVRNEYFNNVTITTSAKGALNASVLTVNTSATSSKMIQPIPNITPYRNQAQALVFVNYTPGGTTVKMDSTPDKKAFAVGW